MEELIEVFVKEQHKSDDNKMIGIVPMNALFNLLPLCRVCHTKVHQGLLKISTEVGPDGTNLIVH